MRHDPIPSAFMAELNAAIARAGGQSALARKLGVPQASISATLCGVRHPISKVVEAIGWEKVAVIRRKKG